jgi:hypothetical protein
MGYGWVMGGTTKEQLKSRDEQMINPSKFKPFKFQAKKNQSIKNSTL